jgi:hypothetical protein
LDLDDFSLLPPVGAAHNEDFIVFADGEGSDAMLLAEVLGEGGGHDAVANMGRGGEVGLPGLAAAAGDFDVGLHLWLIKLLNIKIF